MGFRHFACLAALAFSLPAFAQTVTPIETDGGVTAITQTPRGSYVETTHGTFRLERGDCAGDVCVVPDVIRGLPEPAPEGALPDGKIARADTGDIRKAWYGQPTERYQHCVLGDCVEGGSLVVENDDGALAEFVLPDDQVFEDITPRLFDFYNDGTNEVVTIRASRSGGAAVVIYGLEGGHLVEVAASSENGRPNRWLNIIGIFGRDFLEPNFLSAKPPYNEYQVLFVRTPHIGGRLSSLALIGGRNVERNDFERNLSNHVIGSRELDLGGGPNTKNLDPFYVPSQDRRTLRSLNGIGSDIALPAPVDKAIIGMDDIIITATEDGTLLAIKP